MEKERFVETGRNSFFGDYLYDLIVPEGHFLRILKKIIPWERFTRRLIGLYKGGGIYGRPPFDPALMLKMQLTHRVRFTSPIYTIFPIHRIRFATPGRNSCE